MIPRWILKAVVQKAISYLPFSQQLNFLIQKHITGGVTLNDAYFGLKLGHASDHIRYFRKYGNPATDAHVLELGTGWYPIVPLAFFLAGTGQVTSVDIQNWVRRENHLRAIDRFIEWQQRGELESYVPDLHPGRWETLVRISEHSSEYSLERINSEIGLTCVVQDARALSYEPDSFDFICSNNTLEHIREEHLRPIFREFQRVLRPDGGMSHFIDLSDHFAHFDPSLSIYHFLRYSKRKWRRIDNRIQHMNRLRWKDYLSIYKELGIPCTEEQVRKGNPEELARVPVHPEFSGYSRDELAVSHGYLISHPHHGS